MKISRYGRIAKRQLFKVKMKGMEHKYRQQPSKMRKTVTDSTSLKKCPEMNTMNQ